MTWPETMCWTNMTHIISCKNLVFKEIDPHANSADALHAIVLV